MGDDSNYNVIQILTWYKYADAWDHGLKNVNLETIYTLMYIPTIFRPRIIVLSVILLGQYLTFYTIIVLSAYPLMYMWKKIKPSDIV